MLRLTGKLRNVTKIKVLYLIKNNKSSYTCRICTDKNNTNYAILSYLKFKIYYNLLSVVICREYGK
jgi:hypothetical protein